ncbi:MAG: omptin family outer membrane protease [Treponemataceae bacterium]|nr:omptin family outer membrane protease [Treponemataceae bacterium]
MTNIFQNAVRPHRFHLLLPLVLLLSAEAVLAQAAERAAPSDSPRSSPSGVHFSVGTTAGTRRGTLVELLFRQDRDGIYKKISELDWQLLPAFYLSASAELHYKAFDFSMHAGGFLPGRSGFMEDSDWLALDDVKNIYSISENSISRSFFFGTEAAWNAPVARWLRIRPSFGLECIQLSFSAENGYGWYGDADHSATGQNVAWDSGNAQFFDKGRLYGITYTYGALFTWTGVSAVFLPAPAFNVRLSAEISPFFYAEAVDHHLGRANGTFYMDAVPGFFAAGRAAVSLLFHATERLTLTTAASFTKIRRTFGTSYSTQEGEGGPYYEIGGYQGGTAGRWMDVTLSAAFRLF